MSVCVLIAQSFLTPCDPMDCSPPGSSHTIRMTISKKIRNNSVGKDVEKREYCVLLTGL